MNRTEAIIILEGFKDNPLFNSTHAQALDMAISALSENKGEWIPVSERLPYNHEYIKNNGLFNVSDGNRSYFAWFDIYDTQQFGEPTMSGFRVDYAVIAWMPLPEPYKEDMRGET